MSEEQPRVLWRHKFPSGVYELRQKKPGAEGIFYCQNVIHRAVPAIFCADLAAAQTSKAVRARLFLPDQETDNTEIVKP